MKISMLRHRQGSRCKRRLFSLIILACATSGIVWAQQAITYDVVIAGAGSGGTAAAIQAARLGSRVALLEESDWIGGQTTAAGVGTMDEAFGPKGADGSGFYVEYRGRPTTAPSGIYAEFINRVRAFYQKRGKTINTCYWNVESKCIDPIVGREILTQMIKEVNSAKGGGGHIDLYLRDRVVRVLSTGTLVTGVVTSKNQTFHSKILIDATEYGDVLPLTPARYRSGQSIGEDHNNGCIQSITWTAVIKKYPNGVPPALQMHTPPPGYDKWLSQFRSSMRSDGNPVDRNLPVSFPIYVGYRAVPDLDNPVDYTAVDYKEMTRTSMNWFNDLQTTTAVLDRDKRKKILCEAKLKTLANLYYIQNEMGEKQWSVANDEGYDTPYNRENSCPEIPAQYKALEYNMPQIPYVRESNRLIGIYTLTGGDIRRDAQGAESVKGFTDGVAIGDYADDLHSCNDAKSYETDLEHISDMPPGFLAGPYQVPLRSFIPETVDGLLVAEKNLSQSRLASASTRLQPITMLTGQAAGMLAGLAIADHTQPRNVPPEQVQIRLLQTGDVLAREHMMDLEPGSKEWQAAQFVVTHQWMQVPGKNDFRPELILPRGLIAQILVKAYLEKKIANQSGVNTGDFDAAPLFNDQSYADIPLYSPLFNSITALRAAGAAPICTVSPKDYCPNSSLTIGQFVRSVAILSTADTEKQDLTEDGLRNGITGMDDEPVTRIDAAMILYNSAARKVARLTEH